MVFSNLEKFISQLSILDRIRFALPHHLTKHKICILPGRNTMLLMRALSPHMDSQASLLQVRNRCTDFVTVCAAGFLRRLVLFTTFTGLGIPDLKRAALEYIKSSLTPENILAEFCSTFTLNFDEVLQIEQEYFISHWVC